MTRLLRIPALSALFFCLFLSATSPFHADKKSGQASLTISYKVIGTIEGYSYPSKLVVEVDGTMATESSVKEQTEPNSVQLSVPTGKHHIRAVLLALYEGKWEERTIANNYSIDFLFDGDMMLKKKHKLQLTFDIDKAQVNVKK